MFAVNALSKKLEIIVNRARKKSTPIRKRIYFEGRMPWERGGSVCIQALKDFDRNGKRVLTGRFENIPLLEEAMKRIRPNLIFLNDAVALKRVCDFVAISKENESFCWERAWMADEESNYVLKEGKIYGATSALFRCSNVRSKVERPKVLLIHHWDISVLKQTLGRIREVAFDFHYLYDIFMEERKIPEGALYDYLLEEGGIDYKIRQ